MFGAVAGVQLPTSRSIKPRERDLGDLRLFVLVRILTRPTNHPRHAACASNYESKPVRPLIDANHTTERLFFQLLLMIVIVLLLVLYSKIKIDASTSRSTRRKRKSLRFSRPLPTNRSCRRTAMPLRINVSSRASKLSGADALVVSIPNSGRTWTRTEGKGGREDY